MMPTKGSLRPKSVVRVTMRLSGMHWQSSCHEDGSQGQRFCQFFRKLPGSHAQDQTGGQLQTIGIIDAVQIVVPGVGVIETGYAKSQSIIDLVIYAGSHGDGKAIGVPVLRVQRMLSVAKFLRVDLRGDSSPLLRIQPFLCKLGAADQ